MSALSARFLGAERIFMVEGSAPGTSIIHHLGSTTLSITWMTPLSAMMSVWVTLAPSTFTPPLVLTVNGLP